MRYQALILLLVLAILAIVTATVVGAIFGTGMSQQINGVL